MDLRQSIVCRGVSGLLTEFLKNPVSQGVWHLRLSMPFSAIEDLHEWMAGKLAGTARPLPPTMDALRSSYSIQPQRLIAPKISVEALTIYLWTLGQPPILHKPVLDWFQRKDIIIYPSLYPMVEPRLVFINSLDILSGYAFELRDNLVLDMVSLKENALDEYERLLASLPGVENRIKRLTRGKKHGSNHVYRAYALSAHLWLASEESGLVPESVLTFLGPCLSYYDTGQWRTSVVLSAISVEYILSEMFEETFKSTAPDIPLGQLYEKVKVKKGFPEDIDAWIRRTNEIRTKAVHRSAWFASERDALDALIGAVELTIWHYLESA